MSVDLDILNHGENYLPLKRYSDLEVKKQYRIISYETKNNLYGLRVCLKMTVFIDNFEDEGEEEFLYYLSPSYTSPKKLVALDRMIKDVDHIPIFILDSVKQQKEMTIPIYRFVMMKKGPLMNMRRIKKLSDDGDDE